MAPVTKFVPGKTQFEFGMVGILLLGVLIPAAGTMAIHRFFPGWHWFHAPIHTLMEGLGVLAAFSLAILLLFLRKHNRDLDHHIWIICGLLAMGILDGLHAVQTSDDSFVGLRCASTVTGGLLFAMVWLPARFSRSRITDKLPMLTGAAALGLGFTAIAIPGLIPVMTGAAGYTLAARITNIFGGLLFIAAAVRFILWYRSSGRFDDFLFASLCFLFGMAGLMFPLSMLWSADWWFWHLLRLVAFFHILIYVFFIYQQTLTELKELNESLEQRVTERTAQRTQAVEALEESEARFRRLVESVTDYIYTVQVEDGRPIKTIHGPGCITVTGYAPEDYDAAPALWYRMVHEDDRQAVLEQVSLIRAGEVPPPLEHRIIHKDGTVHWVRNTPVPRSAWHGQLETYDGLISDITERKQAEEEIKAYNEELLTINRIVTACTSILDFREILDKVLEETTRIVALEEGSICLLEPDGTLRMIAQRGGGETKGAMVLPCGRNVGKCYYGVCTGNLKPIILSEHEAEFRVAEEGSPHGTGIRFHAAFPLLTGKRTCLGVLCIFTRNDRRPSERSLRLVETITAHMALFIENARLYEETRSYAATLEKKVAERTLELEEANRKLREIDRTKSMFIASMSHELRTPLNSVIGLSSIVLHEWVGPLNDEQKENLSIVLRAGEHLLSLINDVIDVSKIEAGQIEVNREEFDLHDVVAEAVAALEKDISGKGLLLHVENIRCLLRADRRRLLQCILNLLNNATKYTEQGTISVHVREVTGEEAALPGAAREPHRNLVEIAVQDTGVGIRDEEKTRIFEPFARLDSPMRSRVSGTGLGLYLTRKLVTEVLLGEITFTSEHGRGSRFVMTIPKNGIE